MIRALVLASALIATGSAFSQTKPLDPKLAAEFANTLPRGESRDQFVANVAGQWAEADAAAALAWNLSEEERRRLDDLALGLEVGMPANPFQSD